MTASAEWFRKKRLRARAEWHFGGGEGYCAACPSRCEECPYRLNESETEEGWQVWHLAMRLGGQLRTAPNGAVIGYDFNAAFFDDMRRAGDWLRDWLGHKDEERIEAHMVIGEVKASITFAPGDLTEST